MTMLTRNANEPWFHPPSGGVWNHVIWNSKEIDETEKPAPKAMRKVTYSFLVPIKAGVSTCIVLPKRVLRWA